MVYIGAATSRVFLTVPAVITVMRYTQLYAVLVGVLGFYLELLGNNIWKWVLDVPTVCAGGGCVGDLLSAVLYLRPGFSWKKAVD